MPAGRKVVSLWLQNPTDSSPVTVGVPAVPTGQTFVVPPRSAGYYDIDPTKTVTFVNPSDANYAVYYVPT